ncbi:MAG: ribose-phosphate pyrophosphokinase [bacterium]|nr:ribose-phosphate pyrophosphokinase [bacterium]
MKLLSGTSHLPLALEVSKLLKVPLVERKIQRFPDQEISVEIQEDVREEDIFVIQPTSPPANDHLMELLILLETLKRCSARRITAVIPYFGYARQDRKTKPRASITAKMVAQLIQTAGADRVLTLDLHSKQIQDFFEIPVDNLFAGKTFMQDLEEHPSPTPMTVVSPDIGGTVRARAFAKRLNANLAVVDKRRLGPGVTKALHVVGDVSGQHCLILDDLIDSGSTLCQATHALKEAGALSVRAYITHGVFTSSCLENLSKANLDSLTVTNSINLNKKIKDSAMIRQISVAPLLGNAIKRISLEQSVSSLFD